MTDTLLKCQDQGPAEEAAQKLAFHYTPKVLTPAPPTPIPVSPDPTPLIPAPPPPNPSPSRSHLASDREADREALIGYYQRLANIAYSLCNGPETTSYHSGPNYDFCYYSTKARAIADKYDEANSSPPADYDQDTENSDCGRELLNRIMETKPDMGCNNYPDTEGRDYDGEWIHQRARALHQKCYPVTPQPGPRPNPNPAPRGPSWKCPPGCTCSSGSSAGCPVP